MNTQIVFSGKISAGDVISTPAAELPVGTARVGVSAECVGWPETDYAAFACWLDVSFDQGKTWVLAIQFETPGGISYRPDGEVETHSGALSPVFVNKAGGLFKVSAQAMVELTTNIGVTFL